MATRAYSGPASAVENPDPSARLRDIIERALALLDALDGDPDLEPNGCDEPDGCDELDLQHEIRGGALVRAA